MPQGSTYEQRAAERRARLAAIRANKKPSLWEQLNTPLTDAPSRAFKFLTDKIPRMKDSVHQTLNDKIPGLGTVAAMGQGFGEGMYEGMGNIMDSFTSPLGLATTAATGGMVASARAGLPQAYRSLGLFQRGAGAGVAGHGAYNMGDATVDMFNEGVNKDDLGRLGFGAIEAAGGALGLRTPIKAAPPPAAPTRPPAPQNRPRIAPSKPVLEPVVEPPAAPIFTPDTVPAYQEGRYGINRRNWAEGDPMLSHVPDRLKPASPNESFFESMLPSRTKELVSKPIDQFSQMGKPQRPAPLGPVADIGQPPPKVGGTVAPSDVLPAGTKSRLRALGLADEVINKLDIVGANNLLKMSEGKARPKKKQSKETKRASMAPDDPNRPAMTEVRKQIDTGRPFAQARDVDLESLAKMGVQAAIQEIALRKQGLGGFHIGPDGVAVDAPNPRLTPGQRLTDETGAIGPGTEDLMRQRAGQKLVNDDGSVNIETVAQKADEQPHMKSYRDWVNSRRASKVEGILKARDFRDLDTKGMEGIHEFQEGVRSGRYRDVQDYFDQMHQELDQAGVRMGFKENYLPQLWENSKDEVFQIQRRLGLKPKFTLTSVLENYRVGEALGLTPKHKNISELVGWYEQTARKALADREFFNYLKSNDLIRRGDQSPSHWVSLDPDHFPITKMKTKKKEFQGVLKAPPEVAKLINNYLRDPAEMGGSVMAALGDAASLSKNAVLSSGMAPGTALNAHGFNIAMRNTLARGLMKGGIEAAKYLVNTGADNPIARKIEKYAPWKSAKSDLDSILDTAPRAVKHGLTLTTEEHMVDRVGSTHLGESVKKYVDTKVGDGKLKAATDKAHTGINWILEKHGKYFEDPLFRNVVPALKLKHFNAMYDDLIKQGMDEATAGQQAANMTNTIYGGINWEAMGRSRDLQNALRAFILAPDWLESNARIAKGMGKTLKDPKTPEGRKYGVMARNLLAAYVGANILNAALNDGKLMIQNEPGKKLQIKLGTSGTKDRYFNPFGTAVDFFRLPLETLASTFQGDLGQAARILKNRTSTTVRPAVNLLWNQNDFGRPITGRDAYGRDIPVGKQALDMLGEVSEIATPSYLANPMGLATGKHENVEQALLGAVEAPVRYSKPSQKGKRRRRARSRQR